jgi:DNA-binding NarL/FixJ family response regulator
LAERHWQPSQRDLEILRLLVDGMTLEAIGRRLSVSERTIRRRLQAAADALGVDSTLQVVVEAVRRRLI